jgi:hypothetical protein
MFKVSGTMVLVTWLYIYGLKSNMTNVVVGIGWQLCLVALPIFIVLRSWTWVSWVAVTLVATTIFIKFNWYDKLDKPLPSSAQASL